jgi:hypothetical protein
MISTRTIALGPLVSLLFIFHVLCCLPPCYSAHQFFAHYSISYDSNKVTLQSLNTACVRVSLVSSYVKFCTSYSNPPGLGRIFPHLVPLFTFPLLTDVYNTSLIDIIHVVLLPSSPPPFSSFFLTRMPFLALRRLPFAFFDI